MSETTSQEESTLTLEERFERHSQRIEETNRMNRFIVALNKVITEIEKGKMEWLRYVVKTDTTLTDEEKIILNADNITNCFQVKGFIPLKDNPDNDDSIARVNKVIENMNDKIQLAEKEKLEEIKEILNDDTTLTPNEKEDFLSEINTGGLIEFIQQRD